jgi:hypothetical protein
MIPAAANGTRRTQPFNSAAAAKHESLMEQDRFRLQFWTVFEAFVPGTPAY